MEGLDHVARPSVFSMGPAAQYGSLNGPIPEAEEAVGSANSDKALARRSISIFSRRGTDDQPEAARPTIAQAVTRRPRVMTERQKSWMKRRSIASMKSSPQQARGTVLNAVPAAKTIVMSSLEEEMATSPNDEIKSAIDSPSTPRLGSSPLSMRSPATMRSPASPQTGSPQSKRMRKRSSTNPRIGVWMNGVAHWDEDARPDRSGAGEQANTQETLSPPISPVFSNDRTSATRALRPRLSVIIPGRRSISDTRIIRDAIETQRKRPQSLAPVAPADTIPRFSMEHPVDLSNSRLVGPGLDVAVMPRGRQMVARNGDVVKKDASRASSSNNSLLEADDQSAKSRRSSTTTVEEQAACDEQQKHETGGQAHPIISPVSARTCEAMNMQATNVDKPLPPCPPQREPPKPPTELPTEFVKHAWPTDDEEPSSALLILRSPVTAPDARDLTHAISTRSEPIPRVSGSRKTVQLELIESESARTSSHLQSGSVTATPTLSQAVDALELELSMTQDSTTAPEPAAPPVKRTTLPRTNSVHSVHSVMHPPERAPTLPRRSRKREWRLPRNLERAAAVQPAKPQSPRRRRSEIAPRRSSEFAQDDDFVSQRALRKSCSSFELHKVGGEGELTKPGVPAVGRLQELSPLPQVAYEDGLIVLEGPVTLQRVMDDAVLTVASAEDVLLHILEALPSTADLFNTAMVNRGMYRVYLENEMHLIRTVTRNQSPAAAELREWCPPTSDDFECASAGSDVFEHTPRTYMRDHRRDLAVIDGLKVLILERCQTFIRRETAFALTSASHPFAQRFDDAFFRIWCFCKIFGCKKGRDEDVTGQLDWLKGGLLANSSDLSATMNMNLDFEMGSVLLNPPEHFAKGNEGGLSADQLYDMTELWHCLVFLLQPYAGQTRQAAAFGVFDDCEVSDGDTDRQEYLLEEWTAHILTLGPAVVLELAQLSNEDSAYGFALAASRGWTSWTPPQYGGTRTSFLKEPLARLYEERVATAATTTTHNLAADRERKEQSRRRVATLAAEIRLARQSSTFKRLPLIDHTAERAMSVMTRRSGSTKSTFSFQPQQPQSPAYTRSSPSVRQNSAWPQRTSSIRGDPPSAISPTTPNPCHHPSRGAAPPYHSSRPILEPKSLMHPLHRRQISPVIEDKIESFNRMSALRTTYARAIPQTVPDTSEQAIRRITDMGFTRGEAQQALRETDQGDGLRLDRAVEVLLKGMS